MPYAALPPRINSANIRAGSGPDSMHAAAGKWQQMATEMSSGVAVPLQHVLDALHEQWSGLSAIPVAHAAAPFRQWLLTLIGRLATTYEQTSRIVEAYRVASSVMVPLPWIAANRAQLRQLAANNALGQHAATMGTLQAEYQRFWDYDVAVMHSYDRAVSQALSKMTPWESPPSITAEAQQASTV